MGTSLNEPIKVGAIFHQGTVRPAWFLWHGRRYDVHEVTMTWHTSAGRARILHLGVTDGANGFELALNQETLIWRLMAAEPAESDSWRSPERPRQRRGNRRIEADGCE